MQGQYSAGRGGGRYGAGPSGRGGRGGEYRGEQGGGGYGRGGSESRGGGQGGDFRGGGRGGGRGRGGSSFEDRPLQPDREAAMGTAARPGTNVHLMGTEESAVTVERQFAGFPKALQAYGMQPRPKRTGFGSVGRTVQLVANHFPVVCQLKQAFHYDVTITSVRRNRPEGEMDPGPGGDKKDEEPRAPAKPLTPELSRRVIEALADQEKWPRVWGYDGRKNIYAATLFLPQHESSFEVETTDGDSPRERLFKVTIKWAQTISISTLLQFIKGDLGEEIPQDAVQALDVALKHSMSYRDDVKAFARAIFWRDPTKVRPLGNGAEVWLGYQQSLRPSHAGLTLNMDMAATAFLEPQPVVDYLLRAVGMRSPSDFARLTPQQHRTASKAITGIRIEVRLGGSFQRKYTVKGLMPKGPADLTFLNEQDGKEMSVVAYYEERYHISIKQPQVPCINVGTPTKPVWLPPEVCWIVEGQRRLKLDEKQTAEMIKTAAQKPTERKEYIQKCLRDFAKLPEDPVVQAFQMSVDPNFLKVTGRQLPPPELQYSRNRQPYKVVPQPDRGSWDMRDVKFYRPGDIKCFAIASYCSQRSAGGPIDDPASLQNFMWELFKGCNKAGIAVPNMTPVPENLIVWHNPNVFPGDTMAAAHEAAKQHFRQEPDIIFVILPERSQTEIYKSIKRASDSHLGVPSQCFVPKNASIGTPPRRGRDQYIGNVVMKINAKLSGVNACLITKHVKWMDEPFMVFGADVTHPVGFNQNSPSVAAVVGSLDRHLSCFGSQILLQGHRVELLLDLKTAVKKLMVMFYKKNSVKPRRVIMYRDGVSEGQYPQVQRHEIPQIVEAICELNNCDPKDCDIPVTYIVASKGHHTRLFPATPRDGDKNGNVLPGTVVDKGIVHPTEYDFYLNAHASIQGTSRPVHYHVMLDQNQLGPDALQSFTYDMSYLFCRCTRSVSLVPPCYYAHLAAFRGRILVSESLSDTESSVSSAAGPTNVEFAQTHIKLENRMFYI